MSQEKLGFSSWRTRKQEVKVWQDRTLSGNNCFLPAKHHRKSWLYLTHTNKGQAWILHFHPARPSWGAPSPGLGRCQGSRLHLTGRWWHLSLKGQWRPRGKPGFISPGPLPGMRCPFPSHWGDTGAGPVETQNLHHHSAAMRLQTLSWLTIKSKIHEGGNWQIADSIKTKHFWSVNNHVKRMKSQVKDWGNILQTTFSTND